MLGPHSTEGSCALLERVSPRRGLGPFVQRPQREGGRKPSVEDGSSGPSSAGVRVPSDRPSADVPGRALRNGITGILCGIENVLYDTSSFYRRLHASLARGGWNVSLEDVRAAWQEFLMPSATATSDRPALQDPVAAMRQAAKWLERLGLPRSAACEISRASFLFGGNERVRPFPASQRVLAALANDGVRLGALGRDASATVETSSSMASDETHRIRLILRRLGLESRFEIVRVAPVGNIDLACILDGIAAEWQAETSSLVFVGYASGELDAARRAGWKTVAIDPMPVGIAADSLRVADWVEFDKALRAA